MKKKLIALVCALALAVGLVGCSLSTPDSVGTIGNVDISSGLYLLAQFDAYQTAADLASDEQDASKVSSFLKATITVDDATGETAVVSDYVAQKTLENLESYAAIETRFEELGGQLTAEEEAQADSYASQLMEQYGDTYKANGIGLNTVQRFERILIKSSDLLELVYGVDGETPVSDADLTSHLENNMYELAYYTIPLYNTSTYASADDDQITQMLALTQAAVDQTNAAAAADSSTLLGYFSGVVTSALPEVYAVLGSTYSSDSTAPSLELIGDSTVDADAEILSMTVECLQKAGLKDFQLSVGHADFFQGLVEAAGISEEDEEELRELLANKNFFGVEEFAETLNLKAELNELFHMLGSLNVDLNDLKRAKEAAASYPRILAAIHNLEELHKVLEVYGIQKYISFELGIISSYQYYTGIIFSGYTFGSGEPIVKGGRYDKLLTYYGKTSSSIGFAIVIDQLMAALSRQKINITIETNGELIVYTKANQAKAILSAKETRAAGTPVETILKDDTKTNEDYQNYAKRNRIRTVTFMED